MRTRDRFFSIKFFQKIRKNNNYLLDIFNSGMYSYAAKMIGVLFGFFISIYLARNLSNEDFGLIKLAEKIINFIFIIVIIGLPQVLVREGAISYNNKKFERLKSLLYTSYIIVGLTSLFGVFVLQRYSDFISIDIFDNNKLSSVIIVMSIILIPKTLLKVTVSGLNGIGRVWQSHILENNSVIVALILVFIFFIGFELNLQLFLYVYVLSFFILFLVAVFYLFKVLPIDTGLLDFNFRGIIQMSLPLMIVNVSLFLSTSVDTFMLGYFLNAESVGFYSVAVRLIMISSIILTVIVSVINPKIAVMYSENKISEIKALLSNILKFLMVVGVLFFVVCLLFGEQILSIWGDEFIAGYVPLLILSFGQIINFSVGPVGNLLVMSSNEKIIKNITIITVVINIILNILLIREFGMIGAALSTTFVLILNMLLCVYYVKKKLNIRLYEKIF